MTSEQHVAETTTTAKPTPAPKLTLSHPDHTFGRWLNQINGKH